MQAAVQEWPIIFQYYCAAAVEEPKALLHIQQFDKNKVLYVYIISKAVT